MGMVSSSTLPRQALIKEGGREGKPSLPFPHCTQFFASFDWVAFLMLSSNTNIDGLFCGCSDPTM